ncbi:predicted protein [Naegleria gruberi]|uniref:Predicted protein n=1 Tax=Naegleria gruberi TaxID=5762 RepID=D2VV34_NAEGR|nr:uncharacterized protein NAEGRDRAFT_72876 [Naegleria gruberi]EFC39425.1 predicted protein [Naegleria gruberi]|eukprot:XP_002672169.1 predicted protein [Naegleria gruberi strain NEG-M]
MKIFQTLLILCILSVWFHQISAFPIKPPNHRTSSCRNIYCLIPCRYGYKVDRFGCQIACDCNPAPCRVYNCLVACPHGYKVDENGCQVACDCKESANESTPCENEAEASYLA